VNANLKTRLSVDALEAREVPTVVPLNWYFGDPSPQPSIPNPAQFRPGPDLVSFKPIPLEVQPFRPNAPLPLPKPGVPDPWVVRATIAEGKTVSPELFVKLKAAVNAAPTVPLTPNIGKGVFVG